MSATPARRPASSDIRGGGWFLACLAIVGCGGEPAAVPDPAPTASRASPARTVASTSVVGNDSRPSASGDSATTGTPPQSGDSAATGGPVATGPRPAGTVAEHPRGEVVPGIVPEGALLPPVAAAGQRVVGNLRAALAIAPRNEKELAWSPDGEWLAIGGGKEVKLWSARTGKQAGTVSSEASSLAFHPRESLLAIGGSGGAVTLWSIPGCKFVRRLEEGGHTTCLAFSANGSRLAGAAYGGLSSWDMATGKLKSIGSREVNGLESVAISPDGRRIATLPMAGGSVNLWNAATLAVERKIPAHKNDVQGLAFSPDGKFLTTGCVRDGLRTYEVETGEPTSFVPLGDDTARYIHYSPQGGLVAIGGNGLILADPARGLFGTVMKAEQGGFLYGVAFGPGGTSVATTESLDDHVKIFDLEISREFRTLPGWSTKDSPPDAAEFHPFAGGTEGLVRCVSGKLRIVDLADGKVRRSIGDQADYADPPPVASSRDGKAIYVGGEQAEISVLASAADAAPRKLTTAFRGPTALAVSADGKRLAAAGSVEYRDGTVGIVDATTGEAVWTAPSHRGNVRCLAFSADGTVLASGGKDATVVLWDAAKGVPLHRILAHEGYVRSVVFSPDGTLLATVGGEMDHVVALWNVADGRCRALLEGPVGRISGVIFSPDGRLVVAAGADRRLHVWDAATARPLHSLAGTEAAVVQLSAALEEDSLIALAADGTAKWWKFADLVAPPESRPDLLRTPPPAQPDFAAPFAGDIREFGLFPLASAMSRDGTRLALAESYNPAISIYDVTAARDAARPEHRSASSFLADFAPPGPLLRRFPRTPGNVKRLEFSPDGKTLLAVLERDVGGGLIGFDAETGRRLFEAPGLPKEESLGVYAAFSPDGSLFGIWSPGSSAPPLQVHDARTGVKKHQTTFGVSDARFTADGRLAVAGRKSLQLLDAATGHSYTRVDFDTELLGGLDLTADEKTLVVSAVSSWRPTKFHLFELPSGKPIRVVWNLTDASYFCSVSPDGRFVGGRERWGKDNWRLQYLDAESGAPFRSIPHQVEPPRFLAGGDLMAWSGGFYHTEARVRSGRDFFDDALQEKLRPLTKELPWMPSSSRRDKEFGTPSERGLHLRRDGDCLVAQIPVHGRISQGVAARLAATGLPVKFDFRKSTTLTGKSLAALAGKPNVRGLLLDGLDLLDDEAAEAVATLTGLEELWLPRGKASPAWVRTLGSLKRLRTLREAASPAYFGRTDSGVRLDGAGLEAAAALDRPEILEIRLEDDVDDSALEALGRLKSLRELKLQLGNAVTPQGLKFLASLENSESLEIRTDSPLEGALAAAAGLKKLKSLGLDGDGATDAALEPLGKLVGLKRLNLRDTAVTGTGLVHLKPLRSLEEFTVVGGAFRGGGIEHLAGNAGLQRLDLRNAEMFDSAGMKSLGKLKPLRSLRLPPGLTEAGLAELTGLTELQEFEAPKSVAIGPGFKAFAAMPKLEILILEESKATDAALMHLKGLSQLRYLQLTDSEVGDAGAAHLEKLPRLSLLDLSKSKITAAGVRRLAALPSLRCLRIREVKIDDVVLEELRKTYPNLTISRW